MKTPKLDILFEDQRIIVVNKPAGMIVEENPFEKVNVQALVQEHLNKNTKRTKPPYLGVIHRLDRVTSGVILFAKKKSLLKEINEDFREQKVYKKYWALLSKPFENDKGEIKAYIRKDQKSKSSIVTDHKTRASKACGLKYNLLKNDRKMFMYEIEPGEGKFHQIRVLLSHAGSPILGDIKYGDKGFLKNKVALHAAEIEIKHRKLKYAAPLPLDEYWDNFR